MTGTSISVIRHAEAGNRDRWKAPDDLRPLTRGGRLQAQRIAERFANEPFAQVMSSPFVRCVQTVSPLADAHGLSVELRDDLAEGQPVAYLEKAVLEAEGEGPPRSASTATRCARCSRISSNEGSRNACVGLQEG